MVNNVFLIFMFLFTLSLNRAGAAEIEYYWSGAVTKNSVVVCFATDSDAKIRIQYSDNINFRRNTLFSRTQRCSGESNYFSKIQLSSLKPEKTYYYRFN